MYVSCLAHFTLLGLSDSDITGSSEKDIDPIHTVMAAVEVGRLYKTTPDGKWEKCKDNF